MLNLANLFDDQVETEFGAFNDGYAKGIKLMADGIRARLEMVNEFYPNYDIISEDQTGDKDSED